MLRYPVPTALATYFLAVTSSPKASLAPVLHGIMASSTYASPVWLMAFRGTAVPANGTVPICAPIYMAANAVNQSLAFPCGGLRIPHDGLVLVASSTEDDLTTDASATLVMSAMVEEYESETYGTYTTAGDLSTGVNTLEVWDEAAGNTAEKRLNRLRIKNLVAEVRYAVVYAEDVPDANSKIVSWVELAADAEEEFNFGMEGGLMPLQIDPDGTKRKACIVHCQEDLVPGNLAAGNDFNIEATYS